MIKIKFNIKQSIPKLLWSLMLFFVSVGMLNAQTYWGSGSRDLYPDGAYGGRATLRAHASAQNFFPYPTMGTHYVYAEEGETIAIATSAQTWGGNRNDRNSNRNNIRLYGLSGQEIELSRGGNNDTWGRINTRTEELAGPRFSPGTSTDGDKYRALYYTVPTGGTGIYKVEFRGTGNQSDANNSPTTLRANDSWTQTNNTRFIFAWDISVANKANNAWLPGRVYTNVFMSQIGNVNGSNWRGDQYNFYGKFIVHTRDGFMYEVDNNGNAGYRSSFMVNNKGFHAIGDPNTPSYQSIAASDAASVTGRYHDPRGADGNDTYTHKIFYSLPDVNMPASSIGAVPNGRTWLHVPQPDLDVMEAVFEGAEGGTIQTAGRKGGHFVFDSPEGVQYTINMVSTSNPASFVPRIITGYTQDGENRVYWDGKDGAGVPFPVGETPTNINLQLQGAEVHFPYIDMEVNPNGIKLQLYDTDRTAFVSDIVYWDDSGIGNGGGTTGGAPNPRNASHIVLPNGQSSAGMGGATPNGHPWGSSTGPSNGSTFGNNQGMDTWTFARGNHENEQFNITIKETDLEVTSLTADKTGAVRFGDAITYTIKVKNNGNNDSDYTFDIENAPFHFVVPDGFVPVEGTFFTFNGAGCGTESVGQALTFDAITNTFKSELNLPDGCEIVYTIKVKITEDAELGTGKLNAGIMRPNDVHDPDGTNTSDPIKPFGDLEGPYDLDEFFYPPFDPFFEAEHNGLSSSNNIKDIDVFVKLPIPVATPDINQTPVNTPVAGNVLTNDQGTDIQVTEIIVTDANGSSKTVTVPSTETVIEDVYSFDENNDPIKAGTITIGSDGKYIFTPENGYTGNVPMKYTITDTEGDKDTTTLTIEVIPEAHPSQNNNPIAQDDAYMTIVGKPINSNILSNDSDPDGNDLTVSEIKQGTTTISIDSPTQVSGVDIDGNAVTNAGTVTIGADGKITFVPVDGFIGEIDPINYTISDSEDETDDANIYINVLPDTGVNTTFANDDANTGKKGGTLTGNVLENDNDPEDDNQILTSVTIDGTPTPIIPNTEITIPGKGKITFNPDGSYTFVPEKDFVGTVTVEQNVCDNGDPVACDNATLYLTTLDKVSSPLAIPDINQTPQDTPVDGNVLTNDIEGEEGEGITVKTITVFDEDGTETTVNVPTDGSSTSPIVVYDKDGNKTGEISINNKGEYTFTPEKGYIGTVPIEYGIEDENGLTDSTSLTIEVIPNAHSKDNNLPIAQDDAYTTIVGKPITSNILSNDSDVDGNALTVSGIKQGTTTIPVATPTPVSGRDADGNLVANAGTVTIGTDGTITFTPEYGFIGEIDPINYTISDGKGGTDDANIYINVLPDTGVNTTFANDDANTGKKGETLTGNVLENDNDPEGNTQTLTSATIDGTDYPVDGVERAIPGKGKITFNPNGSYTFVPEKDFIGTVVVEQKVCDNGTPVACDTATLYLTTLGNKNTLLITNPMIRQRMK